MTSTLTVVLFSKKRLRCDVTYPSDTRYIVSSEDGILTTCIGHVRVSLYNEDQNNFYDTSGSMCSWNVAYWVPGT